MRWFSVLLLLYMGNAGALDGLEFQLYGRTANGREFDIHPYSKDSTVKGSIDGTEGAHGDFYEFADTEVDGHSRFIGTCRIRQARTYRFTCAANRGQFAGVVYEGRPKRKASRDADERELSKRFIDRFKYGEIAAVYRCVRGCSAGIPSTLLFAWRGD